jgi:hypothetical protein
MRAGAAVSQQITGSFQISGSCRLRFQISGKCMEFNHGPLNYTGVNPRINCTVQRPSN